MTVFATSVLDNFNRANESPVSGGGNWLPAGFAGSDTDGGGLTPESMTLTTNRVTIGGGGALSSAAWVGSGALGDCEIFATLVTQIPNPASNPTTWWLYARVINPGNASTYKAYRVGINNSSPAGASIYRTIGATSVQFTSVGGLPAFSLGDKIGMRVYAWQGAVMIECWQNTGSVWRRACAALDNSGVMPIAGYIGMGIGQASSTPGSEGYDDFSGGAITAPTSSLNTDSVPGYSGGRHDLTATYGSQRVLVSRAALRDRLATFGSQRDPGASRVTMADYKLLARKSWTEAEWGGGGVRPTAGQVWPRQS